MSKTIGQALAKNVTPLCWGNPKQQALNLGKH